MKDYILLLPLIYIFHDFEEIIGFCWFFRNNPQVFKKHPKLTAAYREFTNEGMAIGVLEQLILFFGGLSLLAYYFPCSVLYGIWYGMMLAFTAHLIVHIGICAYVRKFIPSVVTSVICLPVCVMILIKTAGLITFDTAAVISAVLIIPAMMLNMKIGHKVCFGLGRKLI